MRCTKRENLISTYNKKIVQNILETAVIMLFFCQIGHIFFRIFEPNGRRRLGFFRTYSKLAFLLKKIEIGYVFGILKTSVTFELARFSKSTQTDSSLNNAKNLLQLGNSWTGFCY